MKKFPFLFFIFSFFFSTSLLAQKTGAYDQDFSQFQRGIHLYESGQFNPAIIVFKEVYERSEQSYLRTEAEYFIASSAIRAKQKNAEDLMDAFIENYPTHPRQNAAYYDVGHYYFQNRQPAYALKWYDKLDPQNLSLDQRETFYFERGYSYFVGKKYDKAKSDLLRVINTSEYQQEAKYYLGYMAYEGDDYDKASLYFDQLQNPDEHASGLNYYQADKSFKEGEFLKAIEFAKIALDQSSVENRSQLSKIIGESYFNLKQYDEALSYLKDYQGIRGKWEHVDFYQLGYVYFKQEKYDNAISEFNRILDGNDAVAQNAYHHLAQCYLAIDKKPEALIAFKNAAELNFDQNIKSDASLQYAILSYDIGNPFQSVPDILNGYLITYPMSDKKSEIELLLVNAFVTSKNYQAAYDLLQAGNKTIDNDTYQAVTFNLASAAFQDGDLKKAKLFFDLTKEKSSETLFGWRSAYWLGELALIRGDLDDAILLFNRVKLKIGFKGTPESKDLDYALGYAYFNNEDFKNASTSFEVSLKNLLDPAKRKDAILRLADSEFAQRQFDSALSFYAQAETTPGIGNDYAVYQQAICFGLLNDKAKKLNLLQKFSDSFPRSAWRDDAFLALANDLAKSGKSNQAIDQYNQLITKIPNSPLRPKAELRKGLLQYNLGQNDLALWALKAVAVNTAAPDESRQALKTIEQIYVDMGDVPAYVAWLKSANMKDYNDLQFDDLSFSAAEKRYIERDVKSAIRLFEKYLVDFPDGAHLFLSHIYLSELFGESNDLLKRIPHLLFVTNQPNNEYTQDALIQLADAYLKLQKSNEAIPILNRLAHDHPEPTNQSFAHSNLMQLYFNQGDFDKALSESTLLLNGASVEDDLKSKAIAIKARSEIKLGMYEAAQQSYSHLQAVSISQSYLAEAIFYDAFFLSREEKHQMSNERLQNLIKDYPGYPEFSARGLLLMANNFAALKDNYQANYILNHLISNFSKFPEITDQAEALLEKVKSKAAETNASITSDND